MKVGVVTPTTTGRGGIEQVVLSQVHGLRERGHEVTLVTGPQVGSGPVARAYAAFGLAFARSEGLRRCDVLLAHYPPSPWVARRAGRPFVHYFHHALRAAHPTPLQREQSGRRLWQVAGRALAEIDHATVTAARTVAVPSPAIARELRSVHGVSGELLPLGVDTALFRPGPGPGENLLFVGRPTEPYKHLDWALEVAGSLERQLHVVGEPPRRAASDHRVRWLGYRQGPDLVAAYQSARVLLFPSVEEPFGLVPLEAMACGVPVVAWDDGFGPSRTLGTGSAGTLVPPYDLGLFREAAARLLQDVDLHQRLAAAGPSWVRSEYSVDRHLDRLIELLTEAAGL